MNTVYYIHGFGSNKKSSTGAMIKEKLGREIEFIALEYDSNNPKESVARMVEQINANGQYPMIVASSLGGWYAEQIANIIPSSLYLCNPSLLPATSLKKYGVTDEVLEQYKKCCIKGINLTTPRVIVLNTDDNVVPCQFAAKIYNGLGKIVYSTGGHRMTEENADILVNVIKYDNNQLS
jgi:predicted esterase YcpF (UPF0227 family)